MKRERDKTRDIIRHEERERCLALVESYRDDLERALAKNRAKHGNKEKFIHAYGVAEAVIKSMRSIEQDIKYPARRESADFSMEEIEKAERIMAEQNQNPFEV